MKQIQAFGKSILVIIWFYAISILFGSTIHFLSAQPEKFLMQHSNLFNSLSYSVIFIGIYLVDRHRQEFIEALKPKQVSEELKAIVTYIGMGLGAYLIGIMITNALIRFFPDYMGIQDGFNAYEPILRFIAMVILPPLVEEYMFRHKIQGILKEGFGTTIAIIGQALLFGVLHGYRLQKIYAFVLGVLFGYVKEKKSIKATIWMHMTVNFIGWLMGTIAYAMGVM